MNKGNILTAFEILLESIEEALNILEQEIKEANEKRDFIKIKELSDEGIKLQNFRTKIVELKNEWDTSFNNKIKEIYKAKKIESRLPRGLRVPQENYYLPILECLQQLGGKAKANEVLDCVYEKMKSQFANYDCEIFKSGQRRWENTAHWARYDLVQKGYLSSDSERGIWEITQKGIEYLNKIKR